MFSCIDCGSEVHARQEAFECDVCSFWQECICGTGIDCATYCNMVQAGGMPWFCFACHKHINETDDFVPETGSTCMEMDLSGKFV